MSNLVPRIRGFSHSEDEFEDEYHLRDWLGGRLRVDREGEYLLRQARGLGDLPAGSIVLFHFKGKIVGEAVVAQEPKPIEPKRRAEENIPEIYEQYVLFVPETIRPYPERLFISGDEFREIAQKDLAYYFEISPEQYLQLMRKMAEKH